MKAQFIIFFFFSSRRRHTRCYRDWSSDVCSSDLPAERSSTWHTRVRERARTCATTPFGWTRGCLRRSRPCATLGLYSAGVWPLPTQACQTTASFVIQCATALRQVSRDGLRTSASALLYASTWPAQGALRMAFAVQARPAVRADLDAVQDGGRLERSEVRGGEADPIPFDAEQSMVDLRQLAARVAGQHR